MAAGMACTQDSPWYSKIGAAVRGKSNTKDDPVLLGCLGAGKGQDDWQGFDFLADSMEQGFAPGNPVAYTEPPAESNTKEERLVVIRSQSRNAYELRDEFEKLLLRGQGSDDGMTFELSVGSSQRPSFVMKALSGTRNDWVLESMRGHCEMCEARGRRTCGTRQLLRLCQYIETIGEGQAFCVDVELPSRREDGGVGVICDSCGDADAKWERLLTARRPKWNAKHKSLTLDFHGRATMASAKNFMLQDMQGGRYKFLYGKVAEDRFTLDHLYPLGAVQAFAIALSASHWK